MIKRTKKLKRSIKPKKGRPGRSIKIIKTKRHKRVKKVLIKQNGKRQKAILQTKVDDIKKYRISGHESFPCRYAWLPKIVRIFQNEKSIFFDDEKSMIELGVGKNMVRSAKFWTFAFNVISKKGSEIVLTDFGNAIFGTGELDPYLEDISTLWLLHWQLSTNIDTPLLAWDYLFNKWQEPELVPSVIHQALYKEVSLMSHDLSAVTLQQHIDVFFHTYLPTNSKKGTVREDNLDCPLIELELLRKTGDRSSSEGHETVYAFRYEEKLDISTELLCFCIADFWNKRFPNEQTLSFQTIAHGHGSPGQIFKLPEETLRTRLEDVFSASSGSFQYTETAQHQHILKTKKNITVQKLLENIYKKEALNV